MLMKGKPFSVINREGVQIRTSWEGIAIVDDKYVNLCLTYWWSLVEEAKKEEKQEELIIKEPTIWKLLPKKWGNVKKKVVKR